MKLIIFILTLVTFIKCSSGYEKMDGQWKYVSHDKAAGKRIIELNVDNETFVVLKNKTYAKDKNHVYLKGGQIQNADPKTFKVMDEGYSMDKNYVYLDYYKIWKADPVTFELMKFPYSKDKNYIYCGTLPLETVDLDNFEILSTTGKKSIVATKHFIEQNPEYLEIDSKTYHGMVIGDGESKTKHEYFKGHKKIK